MPNKWTLDCLNLPIGKLTLSHFLALVLDWPKIPIFPADLVRIILTLPHFGIPIETPIQVTGVQKMAIFVIFMLTIWSLKFSVFWGYHGLPLPQLFATVALSKGGI